MEEPVKITGCSDFWLRLRFSRGNATGDFKNQILLARDNFPPAEFQQDIARIDPEIDRRTLDRLEEA